MKPTVIMLHGWGGSKKSFQRVIERIDQKKIDLIAPDLPGFGEEKAPEREWGIDDYVNFVLNLANKHNLDKFYLFGHSFGGRISLKLSAKYPEKILGLILCASAGIKHPPNWKQIIFYPISQLGKKLFLSPILKRMEPNARKFFYWIIREKDYFRAEGIMKQIFKNVINEDLTPYLSQIQSPTLIIWGKKDRITPLDDGLLMHQQITASQIQVIGDAGHYLPKEKPDLIAENIKDFILERQK